jgi:hypothetical protein
MTKVNLVLDKGVTVMEELGNGNTSVYSVKYRDLPNVLNDINEVAVKYYFGQAKLRVKQLTQLGFSLKETIYYNDEAPHLPIKQIWSR